MRPKSFITTLFITFFALAAGSGAVLAEKKSGGRKSSGSASVAATPEAAPESAPAPVGLCSGFEGVKTEITCECPEGFSRGSVWGSGPYTEDSDMCTAALHSGAIGPEGGVLRAERRPGQDSYDGTAANGVTTSSWGSYGASFQTFAVDPFGSDATASAAVTPPKEEPEALTEAMPAQEETAPVATPVPAADDGQCRSFVDGAETLTCSCPEGFRLRAVWGTGPYTDDSDICTAALHAGVIGTGGGMVRLDRRPGQDSYESSSANGVTTSAWASYGSSFDITATEAGAPVPATTAEATETVVPDTPTETAETAAAPDAGLPACSVMPEGAERLDCSCIHAGGGSVWGSGPYTADSDICSAARHAGVIGADGGTVRVLRTVGLSAYSGSTSNGVSSSSWGAYGGSILFDRN